MKVIFFINTKCVSSVFTIISSTQVTMVTPNHSPDPPISSHIPGNSCFLSTLNTCPPLPQLLLIESTWLLPKCALPYLYTKLGFPLHIFITLEPYSIKHNPIIFNTNALPEQYDFRVVIKPFCALFIFRTRTAIDKN